MTSHMKALCQQWHEEGRSNHEKSFPSLPYDEDSQHSFYLQGNYAFLLEGNGREYAPSICYAMDLASGIIYPIDRRGLIKFRQPIGTVDQVTGRELRKKRLR